jgi:hypothetical protein
MHKSASAIAAAAADHLYPEACPVDCDVTDCQYRLYGVRCQLVQVANPMSNALQGSIHCCDIL